jgi:hypothetical protein
MSPDAPISTLRLALRLANGFALSLLQIHRGGRDFTDALIVAALLQSNAAAVSGNPELQRRYACFADPVPNNLRRPISVNAIACSLGLPFETVRRRVKRLVADGCCEATAQGVRLADRLLASEAHRRALDQAYETVQGLYLRLQRANCLPLMGLPPYAEPFALGGEPPVRIVWRASAEYLLRLMEMMIPHLSSLTQGFIVLEVVRANTHGLSDSMRGEDSVAPEAFVPDSYRRPVRASEVAARLGLPHETVRRNILSAIEDGRIQRVQDGFIVPAAVLARPNVLAAWGSNFRDLSRMFGELAETGVLARWEAERAAAESAA